MASVTFTVATGGDGLTYNDGSTPPRNLANNGHRENFVPMLTQVVNTAANTVTKATEAATSATNAAASAATAVSSASTNGTSTSSVAIGTGSKTFTTQSGKNWVVGMNLVIAETANPSVNSMFGVITSYSGTTLIVNVSQVAGSGTIAAWTISLSGPALTTMPINEAKGADIASAATINLDTVSGNFVYVTGTTTITAVTLTSGRERTVMFSGALTLTHSASLILPGSVNILTELGDIAVFRSDNGNVRVVSYTRRNSNDNVVGGIKSTNIASASTINLTTATGEFVHVTGTTTITAITIPIGAERTIIFDGALTLTHGATLLLPSAANITTAANDRMIVRGDTAGAIVVSYVKADGTAVKQGLVLLATLTPTAAANVDFLNTFNSNYDSYIIIGEGLLPSSSDLLRVRLATGGVVDSSNSYYDASSAVSSAEVIGGSTLPTGIGGCFFLKVINVNSATSLKMIEAAFSTQNAATPTYANGTVGYSYVAANTVSGVRFFWNSGSTFSATGKIRIYGYSNI